MSELNWLMMNEYIVINTLFLFHIPNYNVHLIVHLLLSFQIIPFQLDKYSMYPILLLLQHCDIIATKYV